MSLMHIIETVIGCGTTLTSWWIGDELLLYLRTRKAEAKRRAACTCGRTGLNHHYTCAVYAGAVARSERP